MSQAHPHMIDLATLTTERMLEMVRTGKMPARDSEGNEIDAPLSAAMYARIIDWLKYHAVTMDAAPESGSSIAQIAAGLKEQRGFTGRLAEDDPEEDAA